MATAYQKGVQAALMGQERCKNPYEGRTPWYRAIFGLWWGDLKEDWYKGYAAAEEERQERLANPKQPGWK